MTTWKIHEVTLACGLTADELSQWISRGLFRPSAPCRRGLWRRFDWRDLACLATMSDLRKNSLSVNAAARIVVELRDALTKMEEIRETSGLFFFAADLLGTDPGPYTGLARMSELHRVLMSGSVSVIIVDIAKAYHNAVTAISLNPMDDEAAQ